VTDLERHIPMAERLDNDPGDAGRMARSFLAAMARLAEVEAERDEWVAAAKVYANQRDEHKAALARVEALCDQWDDLPNHVRRDIDAFDVICEVRAAIRGPQDERHEFRPGPFECAHHTGGMNCGLPPDDPIHRGPQDEESRG
jgi:hypothetical protein